MKKSLLFIVAIVVFTFQSFSQLAADNKGISFQGIARDASGNVFVEKSITVTFTFISTKDVYQETQTGIVTDIAGVFSTTIGKSIGSIVATPNTSLIYKSFSSVDFTSQYTVRVQISVAGGSVIDIGIYTLEAVPYAKYSAYALNAKNATSATTAVTATSATTAVTATENGCPVGTMMMFAGTTVPTGWLLCDGRAISRTTYAKLYTVIGNAWGQGDNITTFNLPETRGMFMRGVNGGSVNDPDAATRTALNTGGNIGDKVGTYESNTLEAHRHIEGFAGINAGGGYGVTTGANGNINNQGNTTTNNHPYTSTEGGKETRPKNVSVYYIIKY